MARNRFSFWRSFLFELLGLLLFVGIFNFLLPDLGSNMPEAGLIALGVLFSLIPALLWLVFFYRADSQEPEPKRLVAVVFVGGLLLTAALYQPILGYIFDINRWMFDHWWSQLLGGILIVGFLDMGIVYLTVRYLMFDHPEFDERIDGIIYAVAAGLGVATVVNFIYVVQHGGVDLAIGSIRMVTNALGYGSFAGVLGYFLGQMRFEKTPAYYMPMGMGIAATLTGIYFFLLDRAGAGQLTANPWRDLILAAFVALVTMGMVGALVRRSNEETLRVARLDETREAWVQLPPTAVTAPTPTTTGTEEGTA